LGWFSTGQRPTTLDEPRILPRDCEALTGVAVDYEEAFEAACVELGKATGKRGLMLAAGDRPDCLVAVDHAGVRRGDQGEKPSCLTSECSRDVERCLTKRAPVASLILRPSHSSFSNF